MNLIGLLTTLKGVQVPNSVKAGAAASILIYVAGAVLVASGFAFPPMAILGLSIPAIPLTDNMVAVIALPLGHIITTLVPDSTKQLIAGLAAKLPSIQAMIPGTYAAPTDFPAAPPQVGAPNNINKAAAAIAVIQAHAGFPIGKNGAEVIPSETINNLSPKG